MSIDVVDLRGFYAGPLGRVARRVAGNVILRFWPGLSGLKLVGIGYATPYLTLLREGTDRTLAMMPAQQGVVNWPSRGPCASALVDPLLLPLDDASIDRVLLVHALETSENAEDLLAECWRVLAPGGRLMALVPNRRGIWARTDATPFGSGRPFSRRQLEHLMRQTLFSPENWAEALFVPPLQRRFVLRTARAWEAVGTALALPFAGLHIIDATKRFYLRAPVQSRRASLLKPLLAPLPAPLPAPQPTTRGMPEPALETGSP